MEILIMSIFIKQAYKALPKINAEGRYELKIATGINVLMLVCFLFFGSFSLYFAFFDPARLVAGKKLLQSISVLLLFSTGSLIVMVYFISSKIEYDNSGIFYHDIISTKQILWSSVESVKFTFTKEIEIKAMDGTKIMFSWSHAGFNSLVSELEKRLPKERSGKGIYNFRKELRYYIK